MEQQNRSGHAHEETQQAWEIVHTGNPITKAATILSEAANPLFVAIPTFLIISVRTAPTLGQGILWWIITVVGISTAPFLFVLQGVRKGTYTDHHVSRREQRVVPLLFGMGCVITVFLLLLLLHTTKAMIATLVAVILALAVATVVTRYWKISFHLVGIAGAVTALSFLFGPLFLLLSPLVLLVAWARWEVRAHTLLQALAGTVLAVGITVALFAVFGVIQ